VSGRDIAAAAAAAADVVASLQPSAQMNVAKVMQRLKLEDDQVVAMYVFGSRLWGYVPDFSNFNMCVYVCMCAWNGSAALLACRQCFGV
jgi:hypothetical protein